MLADDDPLWDLHTAGDMRRGDEWGPGDLERVGENYDTSLELAVIGRSGN